MVSRLRYFEAKDKPQSPKRRAVSTKQPKKKTKKQDDKIEVKKLKKEFLKKILSRKRQPKKEKEDEKLSYTEQIAKKQIEKEKQDKIQKEFEEAFKKTQIKVVKTEDEILRDKIKQIQLDMEKYALTGGDKRSKKYTDMKKEIKKIEEEIKELLLPYSEKRANEITKLEEEIKKLNKVKDADKIKELNDKIAILQAEKKEEEEEKEYEHKKKYIQKFDEYKDLIPKGHEVFSNYNVLLRKSNKELDKQLNTLKLLRELQNKGVSIKDIHKLFLKDLFSDAKINEIKEELDFIKRVEGLKQQEEYKKSVEEAERKKEFEEILKKSGKKTSKLKEQQQRKKEFFESSQFNDLKGEIEKMRNVPLSQKQEMINKIVIKGSEEDITYDELIEAYREVLKQVRLYNALDRILTTKYINELNSYKVITDDMKIKLLDGRTRGDAIVENINMLYKAIEDLKKIKQAGDKMGKLFREKKKKEEEKKKKEEKEEKKEEDKEEKERRRQEGLKQEEEQRKLSELRLSEEAKRLKDSQDKLKSVPEKKKMQLQNEQDLDDYEELQQPKLDLFDGERQIPQPKEAPKEAPTEYIYSIEELRGMTEQQLKEVAKVLIPNRLIPYTNKTLQQKSDYLFNLQENKL